VTVSQILCDAVVLYTDTVVAMLEKNGFYNFEDSPAISHKYLVWYRLLRRMQNFLYDAPPVESPLCLLT